MESGLEEWVAAEARYAAGRMLRAISATDLVMERVGFGQRVVPVAGSVLASPVIAHYDPEPDYFFHWFRDSAIVIDALRVAIAAGYAERAAMERCREFVRFSLALQSLDGRELLRHGGLRRRVQPDFLPYLRPDDELGALSGAAVAADVRVNADGTLDVIRWARPQVDGPALRALTLLRWWRQFPDLYAEAAVGAALGKLIGDDLELTRAELQRPCSDIWEEAHGHHYFTELLQCEALTRGADWLEHTGDTGRSLAARHRAAQAHADLDRFWDAGGGFYRSRLTRETRDPGRDLDMSVVLGVLHAGRPGGAHSVLDPKAQATLATLEVLFEGLYDINRRRPPEAGPAMGRYANDAYYGGGAWYIATLGAAEFYFRLAQDLRTGGELVRRTENAGFRERLRAGDSLDPQQLARLAIERGDAFMRTVRSFTPPGGELSEQFDRTTGVQTSARHLSWSYAAFITAAASRTRACHPTPAAGRGTMPAGME
ncbi:MAG: glucan 1,4-alpha-glucosidase [Gammaproteobacteria bacterium]|nr:glucan 1,4-alpha-glucosidase [Gammaproteobacteria bacterium]MBV8404359.1 glucan 1,4-alpha-glucosidase [Gammaproteobacteria bacterium]